MKNKMTSLWYWLKNKNYQWRFKLFIIFPIIMLLLIIDWTTKAWAAKNLDYGIDTKGLPGFIVFKYIINQGSAYGAMADHPSIVIALASILTILCFILFLFNTRKMIITSFAIIFAGSFGNLLARSWAPTDGGTAHGVIDFLVWDFLNAGTYIFNLADMVVNVGIGFAILTAIIYIIELIISQVTKSHHPEDFSRIEDLLSEIARIKFERELTFWSTNIKKWFLERKKYKNHQNELVMQIKEIKHNWNNKITTSKESEDDKHGN